MLLDDIVGTKKFNLHNKITKKVKIDEAHFNYLHNDIYYTTSSNTFITIIKNKFKNIPVRAYYDFNNKMYVFANAQHIIHQQLIYYMTLNTNVYKDEEKKWDRDFYTDDYGWQEDYLIDSYLEPNAALFQVIWDTDIDSHTWNDKYNEGYWAQYKNLNIICRSKELQKCEKVPLFYNLIFNSQKYDKLSNRKLNEYNFNKINWKNDMKAIGNVPATIGHTLFAKMMVHTFLRLTPKFSYGDDAWFDKQIKDNNAFGIPFLKVEFDFDNKIMKVVGHEGRHRVAAITRLKDGEITDIPVAILYNHDRYPNIPTPEELRTWKFEAENSDTQYDMNWITFYNKLPLTEDVEYIEDTEILINPTPEEAHRFIKANQKYRAYILKNDFFIWNTKDDVTHEEVCEELHISEDGYRFFVVNKIATFFDYIPNPETFTEEEKRDYYRWARELDNNQVFQVYFPNQSLEAQLDMTFDMMETQLNESVGKQYLYHGTKLDVLFQILKDNMLEGSESTSGGGYCPYGVSTSRSLNFSYNFAENSMHLNGDTFEENQKIAVIVLDRDKLKQNHKIITFHDNEAFSNFLNNKGDENGYYPELLEKEEVVLGDIRNVKNYIVGIYVSPDCKELNTPEKLFMYYYKFWTAFDDMTKEELDMFISDNKDIINTIMNAKVYIPNRSEYNLRNNINEEVEYKNILKNPSKRDLERFKDISQWSNDDINDELDEDVNLKKLNRIAGFYFYKTGKWELLPRTTKDLDPSNDYDEYLQYTHIYDPEWLNEVDAIRFHIEDINYIECSIESPYKKWIKPFIKILEKKFPKEMASIKSYSLEWHDEPNGFKHINL